MIDKLICLVLGLSIGFAIGWVVCAVMTMEKIEAAKEEQEDGK